MSSMCSCKVTLVFHLKDESEICSNSFIEDMKVIPTMLSFLEEEDMLYLLNSLKTGHDLIDAIDKKYLGMYKKDEMDTAFNFAKVSKILFDNVKTISITEDRNDEYGETIKTFFYYPETKECISKTDDSSTFMDNYNGDNKNAEAILSMYNMGGDSPEEIAEILGISIEEVVSVIEDSEDLDYEE